MKKLPAGTRGGKIGVNNQHVLDIEKRICRVNECIIRRLAALSHRRTERTRRDDTRCELHIVFDVTLNGFIKLTAGAASEQTKTHPAISSEAFCLHNGSGCFFCCCWNWANKFTCHVSRRQHAESYWCGLSFYTCYQDYWAYNSFTTCLDFSEKIQNLISDVQAVAKMCILM